MLNVDGGKDVDAGVDELQHILVALVVARSRHVGVGQLVDDAGVGFAGEDGVEIHLLEHDGAVGNLALGDDFEILDLRFGISATVRFDEPDDDINALLAEAVCILQHVEGFANAGSGSEVDA